MKGFQWMEREVVVLAGARTAFGSFGGSLSQQSATDLAVYSSMEALQRSNIRPEEIDHVYMGNVIQTSPDAAYLARHVGLRANISQDTPALTVNRLCGSGFQALICGAEQILLGRAKYVLVGGTENMSQAPYLVRDARWGVQMGTKNLADSLWEALTDSYNRMPMAITAENLAKDYKITREDSDLYSWRSQSLAFQAKQQGVFSEEIVPIALEDKKGLKKTFSEDEHPRKDTTLESLKKLKPVFDPNGVVTAGSASGICDGACSLVLTTKAQAERRGLSYLGKILSYGVVGCDPDRMGIGPVQATRRALQDAKKTVSNIDLWEINEAFAPQVLAVEKELGLPREKMNIHGGAIALGHPLGASGARLSLSLLLSLRRKKARYGVGAACIGGGQGISVLFENHLS